MGITILRQYFTYDLLDSNSLNVTLDITMKVTGEYKMLLLPRKGFSADLRITDSDGKNMIILSDHEFKRESNVSMDTIKKSYLKKISKIDSAQIKQFIQEYRIVAVLFNKSSDDDYYEKVKIQWTEKPIIRKDGMISDYSSVVITMPRHGFEHNSLSAIYVSIKSGSRHEIIGHPRITNHGGDRLEYDTTFDKINHRIYRFKETRDAQFVQIEVKMGMPSAVVNWAKMSSASAIIVPLALILFAVAGKSAIPFTFELMAGITALLVGQRVLVFRDVPLMKRWSSTSLWLIGWCLVVLLSLMLLEFHILTDNCEQICQTLNRTHGQM